MGLDADVLLYETGPRSHKLHFHTYMINSHATTDLLYSNQSFIIEVITLNPHLEYQ